MSAEDVRPGAAAGGGAGPADRSLTVCVYCSSSTRIDAAHLELAAAVGTGLARRGYRLVTGGGSVSMMGAVARAARAAGAHTTGVIPRHLVGLEVADVDADDLVMVETMRERKAEMDRRADGFVALAGGIGTLEELFEVWTAASLGMHAKPVVVLDPGGFYDPLWRWLDDLVATGFVRAGAFAGLTRVGTVDAALRAVEQSGGPGAAPGQLPVG